MFYLYIIYSEKLDRYYVGHSADPGIRLTQHNCGESSFTSKASDWELVFQQSFDTRKEAHARELEIKKKKSRKYIEWLITTAARGFACPECFRGRGHRFDSGILHDSLLKEAFLCFTYF